MATYVVGDVHGCFTQFMELKNKVEKLDADARFILLGDIVGRGPEEEKMLEWVYNNVTPSGKYQLVRGNHDDTFIEMFGKGEFDTIYSVSRNCRYDAFPDEDEFAHLTDTELMYQYAAFLSKVPLVKNVEVGGKKFAIVHAWIENGRKKQGYRSDAKDAAEAVAENKYWEFYVNLWERDIEYDGRFEKIYEPVDGEMLIHGHTPTLRPKVELHRGQGLGKVWKFTTSINVDCGLVFSVTKHDNQASSYGNLAAYCLESDETTYLWELEDPYLTNDGEYYEDKQERLVREAEIARQKYQVAKVKFKPYMDSFEAHLVDRRLITAGEDYRVSYNFLDGGYLFDVNCKAYKQNRAYDYNYDFDFKKELAIATFYKKSENLSMLFFLEEGHWHGAKKHAGMIYQPFRYQEHLYLLGVSKRAFYNMRVTVNDFYHEEKLLDVTMYELPDHDYTCTEKILADNVKISNDDKYFRYFEKVEALRPTGLMTCDVYVRSDLLTVRMMKIYDDVFIVSVINQAGVIVTELFQPEPRKPR